MSDRHQLNRIHPTDLSLSTYTAGLLQSQAYRALKQFLGSKLAAHDLTMPEWGLLGILHDHPKLRLSALSDLLHVEASLTTTLVKALTAKGWVATEADPSDSRAKLVKLTSKGRATVEEVEGSLRSDMKNYLSDVSSAELVVYVSVLSKLAAKAHR